MIDKDGFRPNVGIVVANRAGQVLWARRRGEDAWQFPQGGVKRGETPEQALYRELEEELGLHAAQVECLGQTSEWLHYRLPRRFVRRGRYPVCIGQKQRWFLLRLLADDRAVRLDRCQPPEFDGWRWVDYWLPLDEVIHFKREVYAAALKELAPLLDLPPSTATEPQPAQTRY